MKRYWSWMRIVLPPSWVWLLWASTYLLLLVTPQLIARSYGVTELDLGNRSRQIINLNMGLFVFVYAAFRAISFHPYFNPPYLDWLSRTPWTYGKPLPNGPLHLVLQDAIVVGLLAILHSLIRPEYWFLAPVIFLTTHALIIGFTCLYACQFRQPYLMAVLLSGFLYFYQQPILLGILIGGLSIVAYWGIRDTLRGFHDWSSERFLSKPFLQLSSEKAQELKRERLLGWPYDRTGPSISSPKLSLVWSAAIAILTGWWTFSIFRILLMITPQANEYGVAYNFLLILLGIVSLASTSFFLSGHAPPINLWGRIRTGQWIIPGYDQIFISPLGVASVLLLSTLCATLAPDFLAINAGLTTCTCVFLSFFLTPDLTEWRLTGNHRIHPGFGINKTELIQTQ